MNSEDIPSLIYAALSATVGTPLNTRNWRNNTSGRHLLPRTDNHEIIFETE